MLFGLMASSNPGDLVMDFFAGSGTLGAVALQHGRRFILVDNNPQSMEVMAKRFAGTPDIDWITFPESPDPSPETH